MPLTKETQKENIMNKNINLGLAIVCFIALLSVVYLLFNGGKLPFGLVVIAVDGLAVWVNAYAYIVKRRVE